MAADRAIQARMRRLQTRHLDAAQYAIRRREKGIEPNTVQYSARIISIFPHTYRDRQLHNFRLPCGDSQSTDPEKKVRIG